MKASIIIPTFNKSPRLYLTLLALCAQTSPRTNFEVIVVDDGSTDDTLSVINRDEFNYDLRYLYQRNQGRSSARNYGAKAAKYPLLLFIDDDCLVSPDYVEENCTQYDGLSIGHNTIYDIPFLKFIENPMTGEVLKQFKHTNLTGAFTKEICISPEKTRIGEFGTLKKRLSYLEKQILAILNQDGSPDTKQLSWLACTGASISISAEAFNNIGGFDICFGKEWGCEDLELGFRLYIGGYNFKLVKNTMLYHMTHYRNDPENLLAKAMEYTYQKHKNEIIHKAWKEFFKHQSNI